MLRKILNHLDPGYHVAEFARMGETGELLTSKLKAAYHTVMVFGEDALYGVSPILIMNSLGIPLHHIYTISALVDFPTVVGITLSYGSRRKALNSMGNGLRTVYQKSKAAKDFLAQKLGFRKETENWVNLFYSESI